ncbi:ras GEF [Ceratobasidium sp. AG-I]|nr:ras GEF [Ceratobasidium sp. AG-I]
MSHGMLNMMLDNEKMPMECSKESEPRLDTTDPASQARGPHDSLAPLPKILLPHAPFMKSGAPSTPDSGDDTEPDELQGGIQPSFGTLGSFNGYYTAATSPTTSVQQNETLTPSRTLSPSPSAPPLRRSISADRLTMRPTRPPNIAPPLVRTQSDGQTLVSAIRKSIISLSPGKSPTKPSFLTAPSTATRPRASSISEANAALNTYSAQPIYSIHSGLVYTSSDTESSSDQMTKKQPDHARSTRPSVSPLVGQPFNNKGKGRATLSFEAGYDTDTTGLSLSDAPPSPRASIYRTRRLGSSDDTDEEKRYETISEDVSDAEDLDITTHIPTTASMPPLPPPTVSRSRSSSRSLPSAFQNDIPPVPPLPPFVLLGNRTSAALSSPRLGSESTDQRSLQTPTPTQTSNSTQPPTPSPASASTSFSYSSAAPSVTAAPPVASSSRKTRQRSISESGGTSGAGSGSGSGGRLRGRLADGLSHVLRKSPSPSPGRGIEHIKPTPSKSKSRPKYTIAFIGSKGCGKTTTIDKASKMGNSKLKAETTTIPVCYGNADIDVKSRDAAVIVDKSRDAYPVATLEFDSKPFIDALASGAEFWPSTLPHIDGVVLCYDASRHGNDQGSFEHILPLNDAFAALRFPIIWVACKSDWVRPPKKETKPTASPRVLPEGIVSPQEVFIKAGNARTGLIEVTKNTTYGREQMRNLFTWMYKAVGRSERERQAASPGSEYLNHASPEVFDRKIQSSSKPSRPIPSALPLSSVPAEPPDVPNSSSPVITPKSPLSPTSLLSPQRTTRARSMSDLLSQAARDRVAETSAAVVRKASAAVSATNLTRTTEELGESRPEEYVEEERISQGIYEDTQPSEEQTSDAVIPKPRLKPDPFAFATLDQLIVRLCGGVIPGLNYRFNADFMLTYRRFTYPRALLLGIIRHLRAITDDEKARAISILSDYLVEWTRAYPNDFAAPGAIAPLETLIRTMVEHSMEGAQELVERLEVLRTLTDDSGDWAKPTSDFVEHPDSDTDHDTDSRPRSSEANPASRAPSSDSATRPDMSIAPTSNPVAVDDTPAAGTSTPRPRLTFSSRTSAVTSPPPHEPNKKELIQAAKLLLTEDPEYIAEEITKGDLELFLSVKPRDWMRHAYIARDDRDAETHILDQIAHRFERIGNWVASLMLASEKRRYRGRMFELFIRVSIALRTINNFAALHTVIAAMDKVYSSDDGPAIQEFVQAGDVSWNKWLSMRVLILTSNGGAYRTALKHTSQPLIPTMAIHTSDLVRVMSNSDYKEDNPELIHWGKFQIIAKIVWLMHDLQTRLRASTSYDFGPHPEIARLITNAKPMSEEVIIEKTFPTPGEVPPARGGIWSGRMIRKVLG